MYLKHFGLKETPFSIAPNPRFLYLTHQHQEALAHLTYGLHGEGGVILLTGEVGTGKTTISRKVLTSTPKNIEIAWIINPKLSVEELLATLCDELSIKYPKENHSIKVFTDLITSYLIDAHSHGRNVVLMIDEAQNLSTDVLEQLRLLTNLETSKRKLLQIMLLGQPELKSMLARNDLRQLAQRITARFHLQGLSRLEVAGYIQHRLAIGGCSRPVFSQKAINLIHHFSHGTPRLINLLCDRAMLGVYSQNGAIVHPEHIRQARNEVFGEPETSARNYLAALIIGIGLIASGAIYITASPWQQYQSDLQHSIAVTQNHLPEISTTSMPLSPSEHAAEPPLQLASLKNKLLKTNLPDKGESATLWSIIMQTGTKMHAFQTLAKIWNTELSGKAKDPCGQLVNSKLACLTQPVHNWLLREMNRPAIFQINDSKNQAHYAVIRSLKQGIAVVQLGKQQWHVELDKLEQRWQGRIMLIWNKPPGYRKRLKSGDSDNAVKWLAMQLDHIQGSMIPPRQFSSMDALLVQRVKDFQRDQGLVPDGRAGVVTIMRINDIIGLQSPKLASGKSS